MNHIYNTIFNKNTGLINVVSENTSSHSKSNSTKCKVLTIKPNSSKKKNISRIKKLSIAICISLISQLNYAETYIGDSSTLQKSDQVSQQFKQLLNIENAKGVLGTSILNENNILTINYINDIVSKPDFIVLGYKNIDGNNNNQRIENNNNHIILEKGDIGGDIYSGLSHYTNFRQTIDCKVNPTLCGNGISPYFSDTISSKKINNNNNLIKINGGDPIQINRNIFSGYVAIDLNYGDLTVTTANSYTNTYSNELSTNDNTISITGDNNSINNISSGDIGVNINHGNSTAVDAPLNDYDYANSYISTSAYSNIMSANDNAVSIIGNNNSINNISSGYAGININHGNSTAVKTDAESSSYGSANAKSSSYNANDTHGNTLNINNNIISFAGDNNLINDISSGYAEININHGNSTAAQATATASSSAYSNAYAYSYSYSYLNTFNNVINTNGNKISISGNNNSINDISSGYAGININHGNSTAAQAYSNTMNNPYGLASAEAYSDTTALAHNNILSANDNTISITGDNNSINNISSGYAGINIKYENIIGGTLSLNNVISSADSILTINTQDSKLYANDNEISLNGSSSIAGDLKTGTIDFNIQHGNVEKANGDAGTINISNYLTGTKAYANDNDISIVGTHQFTNPDSVIYGGSLNIGNPDYKPESYDVFTRNTLIYNNNIPISIKDIGNFQTYNFTLNPELGNKEIALITAKNISLGSNESNISDGSMIASDIYVVGIQSSSKIIDTDTKFILMQADQNQLTGLGQGHISKGISQQGISLLYDVETSVYKENDQIIAMINSPRVNPQLKALLEGNLSGLMLLTRGADHLSDNLFGNEQHKRGLVPFAIFSGQHSHYNTGSHIKSNSGLFTAGFSVYDDNTVWGAFIENGWDSYKTYNDFNNAPDVHGKGHNRFNGVGVFGRYTFDNQVYLDGILRGGRLHTAFETDNIRHIVTNERASYNISGNYYGASLKGGYDWAWNTQNTVDLSAKYSWASTSSHDVNITGDEFHFNGLNSHRVLLNAENSYQFTPELSLISGLGYEYEFDGKAEGTTYGRFEIDDASVKGSTGVVTAGLHYEPSKYKRLGIDLKGSGYFGKREGGSALLKVDYKF